MQQTQHSCPPWDQFEGSLLLKPSQNSHRLEELWVNLAQAQTHQSCSAWLSHPSQMWALLKPRTNVCTAWHSQVWDFGPVIFLPLAPCDTGWPKASWQLWNKQVTVVKAQCFSVLFSIEMPVKTVVLQWQGEHHIKGLLLKHNAPLMDQQNPTLQGSLPGKEAASFSCSVVELFVWA